MTEPEKTPGGCVSKVFAGVARGARRCGRFQEQVWRRIEREEPVPRLARGDTATASEGCLTHDGWRCLI